MSSVMNHEIMYCNKFLVDLKWSTLRLELSFDGNLDVIFLLFYTIYHVHSQARQELTLAYRK